MTRAARAFRSFADSKLIAAERRRRFPGSEPVRGQATCGCGQPVGRLTLHVCSTATADALGMGRPRSTPNKGGAGERARRCCRRCRGGGAARVPAQGARQGAAHKRNGLQVRGQQPGLSSPAFGAGCPTRTSAWTCRPERWSWTSTRPTGRSACANLGSRPPRRLSAPRAATRATTGCPKDASCSKARCRVSVTSRSSGSGYTLLPPSVHPDGAVYAFVRGDLSGIVSPTLAATSTWTRSSVCAAGRPTGRRRR